MTEYIAPTAEGFLSATQLIGAVRSEKKIPTPDGTHYRTARSTRGVFEDGALPYEAISRRPRPGASKSRTRGWRDTFNGWHPADDWDVAHVFTPPFRARFHAQAGQIAPVLTGQQIPVPLNGRALKPSQPYSLLPNHYLVVPRRWNLGMARQPDLGPAGIPASDWEPISGAHLLSVRWYLSACGTPPAQVARRANAIARSLNRVMAAHAGTRVTDERFGAIVLDVCTAALRT